MSPGGFPPPTPRAGVVGVPASGRLVVCSFPNVFPEGLMEGLTKDSLGACGGGAADEAPAALARSTVTELFVGCPRTLPSAPSVKRAPCTTGVSSPTINRDTLIASTLPAPAFPSEKLPDEGKLVEVFIQILKPVLQ